MPFPGLLRQRGGFPAGRRHPRRCRACRGAMKTTHEPALVLMELGRSPCAAPVPESAPQQRRRARRVGWAASGAARRRFLGPGASPRSFASAKLANATASWSRLPPGCRRGGMRPTCGTNVRIYGHVAEAPGDLSAARCLGSGSVRTSRVAVVSSRHVGELAPAAPSCIDGGRARVHCMVVKALGIDPVTGRQTALQKPAPRPVGSPSARVLVTRWLPIRRPRIGGPCPGSTRDSQRRPGCEPCTAGARVGRQHGLNGWLPGWAAPSAPR